jgi:predicted O-linked N-acetylglucosamine transferase (SPINDLY family)
MNLLGRVDESLEGHRRSIALEPQNGLYASNLLLTLNYHPDLSPAEIVAEHRAWAQRGPDKITASAPPHPRPARGEAQRRLRIGYISPDFRDHPVRDFFEPILRSYDRTNFEIFCYSDVVAPDTITARIKAMADHWRPIFGIDDLRTSQLIREDKIDILVELAVHTAGNRLLTLAHRPAPIQMSYLGYAATTGMTAVDYRITDGIVDPPDDHASRGPEKLLRLPRIFCCYDPPDVAPEVAPLPAATTNHITFGGLCTIAKVNRAVIELWSQVLHAVPQSRLLLRARGLQDPEVQADFATRFAAHGISRERLEMLPGTNFREYLATFNSVDIAFDPFPFNAHTTDCHALWMGVPFITLPGRTSVSRVGASLLSAVSLPQLIASSPQDYVRIAQTLSSDLPALAEMRATFRERLRNSPLLDAKSFTADLEAGYRQAWTEFCATT